MGKAKIKIGDIFGGDKVLWIIILVLSIFSILVIYSSTASMAYKKYDGDTSIYLIRQARYVGLGLFVAFIVHLIDYQIYFKYAKQIFIVSLFLMTLTFFSNDTGASYNDAARWVRVKYVGLTFQPADLLKIALVIIMAKQLAVRQRIIDKLPILPSIFPPEKGYNSHVFYKSTLPLLGPIALSVVLVMTSSLSTALIIGGTSLIIFIIGRVRISEIMRLILLGMIMLTLLFAIMKVFGIGRTETWENRIKTFMAENTPKDSKAAGVETDEYQAQQARIAVASGWLMGKGPGQSTQRSNLPHPYSDYAYAFIIEEYGLLGAMLILGCYLWIFYRAIVIFRRCDTPFPSIMVLGLSLVITLQAFLHMAVSTNIAPVTGQTLPIISLGGSSLIFTCLSFGIILGVSRQQNEIDRIRQMEEQRKLVVEQWDHVVLEQQEMVDEDNNKRPKGKYDDDYEKFEAVIWDDRYKNNS